MPRWYEPSAVEAVKKIKNQELETEEYIVSLLDRMEKLDPKINCFVTPMRSEAVKKAREIDAKVRRKEKLGLLAGVAVAVKDNMCTQGVRTTCSSRMLRDFVPPYDATVVKNLLSEDAVVIGKTNMDEFAMGSTLSLIHI